MKRKGTIGIRQGAAGLTGECICCKTGYLFYARSTPVVLST